MHNEFWQDRWTRDEIGFHQQSVNQYLADHWSAFSKNQSESVFVPLCGKSRDILWINQKGHPVLGVELSPIACKDFFEEAELTAQVHQSSPFSHYIHDDIEILCGDFFALTPAQLSQIKIVYDRAALIALPTDMRAKYADHLTHLLKPGVQMLLVCMEYPQEEMQGPPFSVEEDEVSRLYGSHFDIEKIHSDELGSDNPFSKRKGLSNAREVIYKLRKR